MEFLLYVLPLALALVVAAYLIRRWTRPQPVAPAEARAAFEAQRDELQRLFFNAASSTGKPRGLRWLACEFQPGLELARERRTGDLLAFVPVTISFEAIPGSDMEGLPAVGNLRSATAVFLLRRRRWTTVGRVLFNLDPEEAIRRSRGEYEIAS